MADQWKPEEDDPVKDVADPDVRGKATEEEEFEHGEDLAEEDADDDEGLKF